MGEESQEDELEVGNGGSQSERVMVVFVSWCGQESPMTQALLFLFLSFKSPVSNRA